MASVPSRLPSCASSCCRVASRVQPQHLERKAPTSAVIHRSLTTSSSTLTHPRPRYDVPTSRKHLVSPPKSSYVSVHRCYHSYDHPSPAEPFFPTERTILAAAYAHVPEHGFSHESLALGARDAGYLDISTNLLPDGVFSLVHWHMVSQREALAAQARDLFSGEERMGLGRKVEALVWERLMGNKAVIGRWQEVRPYQC